MPGGSTLGSSVSSEGTDPNHCAEEWRALGSSVYLVVDHPGVSGTVRSRRRRGRNTPLVPDPHGPVHGDATRLHRASDTRDGWVQAHRRDPPSSGAGRVSFNPLKTPRTLVVNSGPRGGTGGRGEGCLLPSPFDAGWFRFSLAFFFSKPDDGGVDGGGGRVKGSLLRDTDGRGDLGGHDPGPGRRYLLSGDGRGELQHGGLHGSLLDLRFGAG